MIQELRVRLFRAMVHQLRLLRAGMSRCPETARSRLSAWLIGPPIQHRPVEIVQDLDVLLIVDPELTAQLLRSITNVFESLQNFSQGDLSVSYQIADGPIKPLPLKKWNLFFHVLLHTAASYKASPLMLVKNSWQWESTPLVGSNLACFHKVAEPSPEDVIHGKLGIRHSLELLERLGSACLVWEKGDEGLTMVERSVDFTEPCEIAELAFYTVLRASSNATRAVLNQTSGIGIGDKDVELFKEIFGNSGLDELPRTFLAEKKALRTGERWYKQSDVEALRAQAADFLERLQAELQLECVKSRRRPWLF